MNCSFLSGDFKFQVSSKVLISSSRNHFQVFKLHVSASAGVPDATTEDIWNNLKTGLLKTTEEVCGTTRPHRWRHETWWWNGHVGEVITAKRQAFKT